MAKTPDLVVVGQFAGPHGVRGEFKLRSFTAVPKDLGAYGPLTTLDGAVLTPRLIREVKDGLFVATAPQVTAREGCEPFSGALLHVLRAALPAPDEDEYYLDDLVGLKAVDLSGNPAGSVKAVVNYGAGDIVELMGVPDRKGLVLLPFTKAAIPQVDIAAKTITVVMPSLDEDPDPEDSNA